MFQVNIKNEEKNLEWNARFASQELAQEWLSKQVGKPHRLPERLVNKLDEIGELIKDENGAIIQELIPAEFTAEVIDISKNLELQKQKAEAKKFLSDTDWYVIRFIDSGIEIPEEIKKQRQQAREIL
jgi:hypothetical protein